MRFSVFCLFILCFVIQSCKNGNNKANGNAVSNDTIIINKILHQVENKELKNVDTNLRYLSKAEELAKKWNFESGYAKALFLHGNIAYENNNYDEAKSYYSQSLKLSERLNATLLKANCFERMASVHLATDDPSMALKLYYQSLPLFEKVHNTEGIAKVYNIIGVFKTGSHDYDTAEVYLQKAIQLNLQINNRHGIIENEGNLGYLYEVTGKLAEAEKIYLKLVDELSAIDDKVNLPVIYFNLASLFQKKVMIDSALYFLGKAIDIAKLTGDSSLLSTLYGNTGEIFLNKGKRDSATVYLQKSVLFSHTINDVETEMQAMSLLVKVDSLSGNFKSAFSKIQQISVLKDSVYQRRINSNVKTAELQYENEKRKGLIEIQRLSIQSANKERVLYLVLLAVSIITLGLITLVFILRRRNYLRSQELFKQQLLVKSLELDRFQKEEEITKLKIDKIEEVLQIKEREQVSQALAMEQKNELIRLINSWLKEMKIEAGTIDDSALNTILSSIKMQPKTEENGNLFNQKFNSIHLSFYETLKSSHPELTKSELRFCAYLKLNLDRTQVANIHNITTEAIRKTRYRVRKKLGLSPDASLEDYISRF